MDRLNRSVAIALFPVVLIGVLFIPLNIGQAQENEFISDSYTVGSRTFSAFRPNADISVVGSDIQVRYTPSIVNFADSEGKFHRINPTLERIDTGFEIKKAPYYAFFPAYADEIFKFSNQSYFDLATNSYVDQEPLNFDRQYTEAQHVSGVLVDDGILYVAAFPNIGGDLFVKPTTVGVSYFIKFDRAPPCSGDATVHFKLINDTGFTAKSGNDVLNGGTMNVNKGLILQKQERKIYISSAESFDSAETERKSLPVFITASDKGTYVDIAKTVSCDVSFGNDVIYPFYADDTLTVYPSFDGTVTYSSSPVWATMRDAADGTAASGTADGDEVYCKSGDYRCRKAYVNFDTTLSGIVTSWSLQIFVTARDNNDNDGNDYIVVTKSTAASTTSISTADFDQCGYYAYSQNYDISSMTDGVYNTFTGSGLDIINVAGITKLCLIEGHAVKNDPISSDNDMVFETSEHTGTSHDPILTVTYTASGGGTTGGSGGAGGLYGSGSTASGHLDIFQSYCHTSSGSICSDWRTSVDLTAVAYFVNKDTDGKFDMVYIGVYFFLLIIILWKLFKYIFYMVSYR